LPLVTNELETPLLIVDQGQQHAQGSLRAAWEHFDAPEP
jgi:hypothetical protein